MTRRGWAVLVALAVVAAGCGDDDTAAPETTEPQIVIGSLPPDGVDLDEIHENGPGVIIVGDGAQLSPRAEPPPAPGVLPPDGAPPGPPIPFSSTAPGASELTFILVVGSDARPGESVTRSRADSIHIAAVNPAARGGTIVGLPRDSWVEIPGHGRGKINAALAKGGPELLAETIEQTTGIRLDYYVVAGFEGFVALTDDLGGVNVYVDRRMNDANSGARFEPGWHFFHGDEALSYARNRKDVKYGDFSRSEHQGILMLATLMKMQAEIGDEGGIGRWLDALGRHVTLQIGRRELFDLAITLRRLEPRAIGNVVASGTVGTAGGQSVVFLDDDARALFADVADDGLLRGGAPTYDPPGAAAAAPPSSSTTSTSTSTTRPVATSTPVTAPSTSASTTTSTAAPTSTTTSTSTPTTVLVTTP